DRPSSSYVMHLSGWKESFDFLAPVSAAASDDCLDNRSTVVVAFEATIRVIVQWIPKSHPLAPANVHLLCRDSMLHQFQSAQSGEVTVLVVTVGHYVLVFGQVPVAFVYLFERH